MTTLRHIHPARKLSREEASAEFAALKDAVSKMQFATDPAHLVRHRRDGGKVVLRARDGTEENLLIL